MHIKPHITALIIAFVMATGLDASAQSHYMTNQAQESFDLGIDLEQHAETSNQRTSQLEEAAKAYRRAIEADPEMVAAYIRLGYVLYALNRSDEAIQALEIGLKRHPDNKEIIQYLGLNLYQAGKTEDAEDILTNVVESKNNILPEVYFVLGKISLDNKDTNKAQKYFEEYSKFSAGDAKAWQALSSVYIQAHDIPNAEQALTRLLELTPKDIIALINMGHVQYELSHYDEAISYYQKSLEIDSNRDDIYYSIASVYYITQRYEEAIKAFEDVLKVRPDHMSAQYFIADCYLKQNDLKKAESLFKSLEAKMPNYRYIKLKLAYIKLLRGDRGAIKGIRKQLKNATHPDDLHFAGVMLRNRGDVKTSISIHKKLYSSHENDPIYAIYLAREYVEQKEYNEAEKLLKEVIAKDHDALAYEMLSFVLLRQGSEYLLSGDYQQARKFFEDAASLNIHATEAACNLAQLLILEGKHDEAYRSYQKAAQLSPDSASVIKLSAQFDIMDGQYDAAIDKLESLPKDASGGSGWYLLAIAKSNTGHWDEAANAFSMAEKFGVKDPPASASLAIQRVIQSIQKNDYNQAESDFNQAAKLKSYFTNTDKVRFDYLSALLLIRSRKFSQAKTSLDNVKSGFNKLTPSEKSSLSNDGKLDLSFELAFVQYELNNNDAALSLVAGHQSSEKQALEAAIRRKLAFHAMKKQQYNEALDQFNKISTLSSLSSTDQYNQFLSQVYLNKVSNPSDKFEKFSRQNIPEASLNYAIYLDQSGNGEAAREYYKQYISNGKGSHIEEVNQILSTKERVWGPDSK